MEKKRYIILDALRGFAILGIILANFPEFSLWTFADAASHTAGDRVVQALLTFFVDGKFYTLFSLLFGMGFAIQLENAEGRLRTFYRRMVVLLVIGLVRRGGKPLCLYFHRPDKRFNQRRLHYFSAHQSGRPEAAGDNRGQSPLKEQSGAGACVYWYFRIAADRFLRNMVRATVGSLIEVGRGKHRPEWIAELIAAGTRSDAGESVPGHALFLSKVLY